MAGLATGTTSSSPQPGTNNQGGGFDINPKKNTQPKRPEPKQPDTDKYKPLPQELKDQLFKSDEFINQLRKLRPDRDIKRDSQLAQPIEKGEGSGVLPSSNMPTGGSPLSSQNDIASPTGRRSGQEKGEDQDQEKKLGPDKEGKTEHQQSKPSAPTQEGAEQAGQDQGLVDKVENLGQSIKEAGGGAEAGEAKSKDPVAAASGKAVELVDDKIDLGRKIVTLQVIIWAVITFIFSFFTLPPILMGFIPLVILNLNFFSPKTVYKLTEWLIRIIADLLTEGAAERLKGILKGGEEANLRLSFLGGAIILFVDAIWVVITLAAVGIFMHMFCTVVTLDVTGAPGFVTRPLTYVISRSADLFLDAGLGGVRDLCLDFEGALEGITGGLIGGSNAPVTPQSGNAYRNTDPYDSLFVKYAGIYSRNGVTIEPCVLKAMMAQESAGRNTAVSNLRSGEQLQADSPPLHGLNWNAYHAIGLMQITIYGTDRGSRRGWDTVPARRGGELLPPRLRLSSDPPMEENYTVAKLLDSRTSGENYSIHAGAAHLYSKIKENGDNVWLGVRRYNGNDDHRGANSQSLNYERSVRGYYQTCKNENHFN